MKRAVWRWTRDDLKNKIWLWILPKERMNGNVQLENKSAVLLLILISPAKVGHTANGDIIRAPRICIIDVLTYASKQRSARIVVKNRGTLSLSRVVLADQQPATCTEIRSTSRIVRSSASPRRSTLWIRTTTRTDVERRRARERLTTRNCHRTSSSKLCWTCRAEWISAGSPSSGTCRPGASQPPLVDVPRSSCMLACELVASFGLSCVSHPSIRM